MITAVAMAGGLSLAASSDPDGLEWSVERAAKGAEISADSPAHSASEKIQNSSALMPDYNLPGSESALGGAAAGIAGTFAALAAACALGFLLRKSDSAS